MIALKEIITMAIPYRCRQFAVRLSLKGYKPNQIATILSDKYELDLPSRLVIDAKATKWWKRIEHGLKGSNANPILDPLDKNCPESGKPVDQNNPVDKSPNPNVKVKVKPLPDPIRSKSLPPKPLPLKPRVSAKPPPNELLTLKEVSAGNRLTEQCPEDNIVILTGLRYEECKLQQVEDNYLCTDRGTVHKSKILAIMSPLSKDRFGRVITTDDQVVKKRLAPSKVIPMLDLRKGLSYQFVLRNGVSLKAKVQAVASSLKCPWFTAATLYGDVLLFYYTSIYKIQ